MKDLLSQDEIDALLHGGDGGDDGAEEEVESSDPGGVQPYDLASNDRVVRGRMPTLDMINERFARQARSSIFSLLRKPADVASAGVQILKYSDFVATLFVPTSMTLVRVPPLRGTGMYILDAKLVYKIVDCFYGGDGRHAKIEGRELTSTEIRLVRKVVDSFCDDMAEAWASTFPLKFAYLGHEMNPSMANAINGTDVVVVSTFQVDLETGSGDFYVVYPYSMVEPLRDKLVTSVQTGQDDHNTRWQEALQRDIMLAKMRIDITLSQVPMRLADVVELKKGDLIPIEIPEKVKVKVNRVPVFEAELGESRGKVAAKIVKVIPRDRRIE
ncbi:MAG: flagellar motor switch protein FliM [Pontibacterium sp.]